MGASRIRWATVMGVLGASAVSLALGGAPVAAGAAGEGSPAGAIETEPSAVHVGDPVTVRVRGCAPPLAVTSIEPQVNQSPKGPWAPVRFDPETADVRPTVDGITFTFVPSEPEAGYRFVVTCSDGHQLVTPDAEVISSFPPRGELWFVSVYGRWGARQGETTTVTVRSLECIEGSPVTGVLDLGAPGAEVVATAPFGVDSPTVADLVLVVPATARPGDHPLTVTCPAIGGGTITDSVTFSVWPTDGEPPPSVTTPEPGGPVLVATGTSPVGWMVLAVALVVTGVGLVRSGRARAQP